MNAYGLSIKLAFSRLRLERFVEKYGLNHAKTLVASQRVDKILNELQKGEVA